MSDELVLRGNTFGISEVETIDETIIRKLALIPMALQVLKESAQTIDRLTALRLNREAIEAAEMKSLGMVVRTSTEERG